MNAILTSITSFFGLRKVGALPSTPWAPPAPVEEEEDDTDPVALAQREFFQAQRELRQAQSHFDSAAPEFIDVAVEDLNIAVHKADNTHRKLRLLIGIAPPDEKSYGLLWLQKGVSNEHIDC